MNLLQSVGSSFLGLPSVGQESMSINYLTLSFKEDLGQYEKKFVFPILIAVYIFSYSKIFKKYMQFVIACIMFITSFGIIVMIVYAATVQNFSYYAGLILIFIFGYTFIRARFIYAVVAGWSVVICYEISAIWV